jgi:hypothetical protein
MNDKDDININPQSVYELYDSNGLTASEIAEKLDIALSDVHFLIGTYHRIQTDVNEHDQKRCEQINADTIAPDEDIDAVHDVNKIRIERMSEDSAWLGAYADDGLEYLYWLNCEPNGLSISHETWADND